MITHLRKVGYYKFGQPISARWTLMCLVLGVIPLSCARVSWVKNAEGEEIRRRAMIQSQTVEG